MKTVALKAVHKTPGFVLVEVMLAVVIFSFGVVALGTCVQNNMAADRFKEEDVRARRALEDGMAMIDAGAVVLSDSKTEDLVGIYAGMKRKTTRVLLKEQNEERQDIQGVYAVTVAVTWKSGNADQSREMTFYYYQSPR